MIRAALVLTFALAAHAEDADSRLATDNYTKLHLGMTMEQAANIVGQPFWSGGPTNGMGFVDDRESAKIWQLIPTDDEREAAANMGRGTLTKFLVAYTSRGLISELRIEYQAGHIIGAQENSEKAAQQDD